MFLILETRVIYPQNVLWSIPTPTPHNKPHHYVLSSIVLSLRYDTPNFVEDAPLILGWVWEILYKTGSGASINLLQQIGNSKIINRKNIETSDNIEQHIAKSNNIFALRLSIRSKILPVQISSKIELITERKDTYIDSPPSTTPSITDFYYLLSDTKRSEPGWILGSIERASLLVHFT